MISCHNWMNNIECQLPSSILIPSVGFIACESNSSPISNRKRNIPNQTNQMNLFPSFRSHRSYHRQSCGHGASTLNPTDPITDFGFSCALSVVIQDSRLVGTTVSEVRKNPILLRGLLSSPVHVSYFLSDKHDSPVWSGPVPRIIIIIISRTLKVRCDFEGQTTR